MSHTLCYKQDAEENKKEYSEKKKGKWSDGRDFINPNRCGSQCRNNVPEKRRK